MQQQTQSSPSGAIQRIGFQFSKFQTVKMAPDWWVAVSRLGEELADSLLSPSHSSNCNN